MIKINLLPPNIFEARVVKRLIVVFVVVVLFIVGASVGYTTKLNKEADEVRMQADEVQRLSEEADRIKAEASSARASIGPMNQKVEFFEAVWDHNKKYPELYEELARFTFAKILYSQLTPSGSALQIQARAPSLSDAGRYLVNLYRATHIFSTVTISAVPGYPQEGGAGGFATAMPGSMPMSPFLSPMPGMPTPGMPSPGMMPTPGYGGLGAISSSITREEQRERAFTFTVSCALREPITAPEFGGAAAGAALGQATPGMGAMPGMPGMPPMPGVPAPAPGAGAAPAGGGGEEGPPRGGRGLEEAL